MHIHLAYWSSQSCLFSINVEKHVPSSSSELNELYVYAQFFFGIIFIYCFLDNINAFQNCICTITVRADSPRMAR